MRRRIGWGGHACTPRAARWVGVKIVLYHARLQSRLAAEMGAAA
jgi:hypothetical protein